jgi:phage terminase large subunit-like protein
MDDLPVCGRVLDDVECAGVGDHFCEPRARHVVAFFAELLQHPKGTYARHKFVLTDWQRDDIIRPLFGETVWSAEQQAYRRRYEIAFIELGRKNGKSALLAGIMLYLLFADGEQEAELYSIAKDRNQASLIFDVAAQMVLLNPILSKRCKVIKSVKRIVKIDTNSVYRVIASDAASALGSNPSGVAAEELLAWQGPDMWDAMRSGMGSKARLQPLLIAATTAGHDTESFGGQMHAEMCKVDEDPGRAPHVFTYIRNTPRDYDPFDESNWGFANPALGDFLSVETMRKLALEARNNPARLRAFQQFQLNQWTNSAISWMPMHLWDDCGGEIYPTAKAARDAHTGRECWFGLDLAARQDLCSMALLFPGDADTVDILWRHWIPEAAFDKLNASHHGGFAEWAENGWLTVTEGEVLDFARVYDVITADSKRFSILGGDADKWSSDPVIQEIESRCYVRETMVYESNFRHMSDGMHRVLEMVTQRRFQHHGNPVARWCFDACEARIAPYDPHLIRPDKPNRGRVAKRIDAVPAAVMAVNAWATRGQAARSIYATETMLAL